MSTTKTKDDALTNLKNLANEKKDDIESAANQAGRKVRKLFNSANNEFSDASDMVTSEIRSNPIRSSAIALGLGVLVGALLRPAKQAK